VRGANSTRGSRSSRVAGVITPDGSERHVVNLGATVAAQAKADEMREAFTTWLWTEPTRTAELADEYNERFNSIVLRHYDDIELSLPGLAVGFEPPGPTRSPPSPG
jgi:N12 class adenine-specific DNA methylase